MRRSPRQTKESASLLGLNFMHLARLQYFCGHLSRASSWEEYHRVVAAAAQRPPQNGNDVPVDPRLSGYVL